MKKTCNKCGKNFPATLDYFYKNVKGEFGLYSCCKICCKERDKEKHLVYAYGITEGDWWGLFKQQKGKCVICKRHQSKLTKTLVVDHDHKTGEIRALLCNNCNALLGYAGEDTKVLLSAIKYLEKFYSKETK